jgi:hypothetical protein
MLKMLIILMGSSSGCNEAVKAITMMMVMKLALEGGKVNILWNHDRHQQPRVWVVGRVMT